MHTGGWLTALCRLLVLGGRGKIETTDPLARQLIQRCTLDMLGRSAEEATLISGVLLECQPFIEDATETAGDSDPEAVAALASQLNTISARPR